VGELGRLAVEILPAGGHVIKEVADLDGGSRGTARGFDTGHLAALDCEFRPAGGVGPVSLRVRAGGDREPGDGTDGVKRLAPEPERPDPARQVGDVGDLAGGVLFDGAAQL